MRRYAFFLLSFFSFLYAGILQINYQTIQEYQIDVTTYNLTIQGEYIAYEEQSPISCNGSTPCPGSGNATFDFIRIPRGYQWKSFRLFFENPTGQGKACMNIVSRIDFHDVYKGCTLGEFLTSGEWVSLPTNDIAVQKGHPLIVAVGLAESGCSFPGCIGIRFNLIEFSYLSSEEKLKAYPNPFNPLRSSLTIEFPLSREGYVSVYVLSREGKKVRTLYNKEFLNPSLASGIPSVLWDGKDDKGRNLPSGIYIIHVQIDYPNGEVREDFSRILLLY